MALDLRYSPKAREDILDIWAYIAERSPMTADRILDLIEAKCSSLADQPRLGRLRPELSENLGSLNIDRWAAYYRVDAETIKILRVIDGVRDIGNIDWPAD